MDTAVPRYLQVALHCADEAGDWPLRAKALADWSLSAEYSGNGEVALTLAQQAMVRPDRLTPLERVWPSAVEARAQGRRGDAEACRAALGRMEGHLAAAEPADESPAMVAHYSPSDYLTALRHAASRHQSVTGVADLGHRLDQVLVSA